MLCGQRRMDGSSAAEEDACGFATDYTKLSLGSMGNTVAGRPLFEGDVQSSR